MTIDNSKKVGIFSKTNPFYTKLLKELSFSSYFYTSLIDLKKDIDKLDFVFFFNPYKDKEILNIYKYCKKNKIKFYIVERGALPDSVFFDSTGFNYDSSSYSKDKWDYELSEKKQKSLDSYIQNETTNDNTLEVQSQRLCQKELRVKLKLKEKKVIFVPLQKRDDTVIKYFCGDINNYDNFIDTINELSLKISDEYKIIVKKHPLETNLPILNDNIIVSDDNIKDLIELSQYVVLINSGVGVLAMMWSKPVIVLGDAFYSDTSLNIKAKNSDEILGILKTGFKPNKEKANRFLSYLIDEFYSFGSFKYYNFDDKRVLKDIEYYILRFGRYKIENINLPYQSKGTLHNIYQNSSLFNLAQTIKKVPFLATPLLFIKNKVLKWDT